MKKPPHAGGFFRFSTIYPSSHVNDLSSHVKRIYSAFQRNE